jgi:hypothetical protein
MRNIYIPPEVAFDLPEGKYKAVITTVRTFTKQSKRGAQEWVRILWEVEVPQLKHLDCRAGRNFQHSLKPGSDLRNFLTGLLGNQFFTAKSGTSFDLESLVETKCVIHLEHVYGNGDYDRPLVLVSQIEPRTEGISTTAIQEEGAHI